MDALLLRVDRYLGFNAGGADEYVEPEIDDKDALYRKVYGMVVWFNHDQRRKMSFDGWERDDDLHSHRAPNTSDCIGVRLRCESGTFLLVFFTTRDRRLCIELDDPSDVQHRKTINTYSTRIDYGVSVGIDECLCTIEGWIYYVPLFMTWWKGCISSKGLELEITELSEKKEVLNRHMHVLTDHYEIQWYRFTMLQTNKTYSLLLKYIRAETLVFYVFNERDVEKSFYVIELNPGDDKTEYSNALAKIGACQLKMLPARDAP